jgi:hypothetical protein
MRDLSVIFSEFCRPHRSLSTGLSAVHVPRDGGPRGQWNATRDGVFWELVAKTAGEA